MFKQSQSVWALGRKEYPSLWEDVQQNEPVLERERVSYTPWNTSALIPNFLINSNILKALWVSAFSSNELLFPDCINPARPAAPVIQRQSGGWTGSCDHLVSSSLMHMSLNVKKKTSWIVPSVHIRRWICWTFILSTTQTVKIVKLV